MREGRDKPRSQSASKDQRERQENVIPGSGFTQTWFKILIFKLCDCG